MYLGLSVFYKCMQETCVRDMCTVMRDIMKVHRGHLLGYYKRNDCFCSVSWLSTCSNYLCGHIMYIFKMFALVERDGFKIPHVVLWVTCMI